MINVRSLLLSIICLILSQAEGKSLNVDLLCRKCGHTITKSGELVNVTAPEQAKYSYDFPIVGRNYTVSVLENPAGETFHVVASKTANLHFNGKASSEATWYPGMQWTICVCAHCKQHMGWYFQPMDTGISTETSKERSFVGLVLDYLISADYADTLTVVP